MWHWKTPSTWQALELRSLFEESKNEKEEETTKDTEVEPDKDTPMVDVTNIVIPVNVDDEKDEITDEVDDYVTIAHLKKRFIPRTSSDQLADNLHDVMMETLPSLVKEKVTEQVKKEVPAQVRDQVSVYLEEGLILERKTTKEETERLISKAILQERGRMQAHISTHIQNAIDNAIPSLVDTSVRIYMSGHILYVHPAQVQSSSVPEQQHQLYLAMKADPLDQDDPHDNAHPEGENSAKRQKTLEYEAYVSGESSSGQVNVEEPGPSTSGNQEQDDEFDFRTILMLSEMIDIPTKQVTQDIMEEISFNTNDELRNYCLSTSTKDHTISSKHQRDPEAPALSLINQDLLYLKKGNSGPEKIVLSLYKFPTIVFNDGDIEEQTSRWYGYVQKELTNDEVEFLKLFEEEIEVRLNYRDQMRRWEIPHKGVKASANSDVMYSFTSAQDGDPLQDDVRLCLGDDLKKAQDHSQRQV
ncbi:hypothetical protein Tco_0491099 [Tanacetum coccineum]